MEPLKDDAEETNVSQEETADLEKTQVNRAINPSTVPVIPVSEDTPQSPVRSIIHSESTIQPDLATSNLVRPAGAPDEKTLRKRTKEAIDALKVEQVNKPPEDK